MDWWEDKQDELSQNCSNIDCSGAAEVGVHVKYVYGNNMWFITPLCKKCNNLSSDLGFFVSSNDLEPINSQ